MRVAFIGVALRSLFRGRGRTKTGGVGRMSEESWSKISGLERGPIQRDSLSDEQLERLDSIRLILVEVDEQSREQWIDSFKRELDPDSELTMWEGIAVTHYGFCEGRELTREQKKEVYGLMILRSGTTTEDVLGQVSLRSLTEAQAREAMDMFRVYPDRQLRLSDHNEEDTT